MLSLLRSFRTFFIIVVTTTALFTLCEAQFEPVQKPGKNDICAAFCEESYKSQANTTEACKQGCSLFSIIQLTSESPDANEKYMGQECVKSCEQSYNTADKSLREACSAGCRNQTVKVGSVQIELDGSSPFINKISDITDRIFSPAMNMVQDMKSKMSDMISSFKDRMSGWVSATGDDEDDRDQMSADSFVSKMVQNVRQMMNFDGRRENNRKQSVAAPTSAAPTVGNADKNGDPIIVVHVVPLRAIEDRDFVFDDNNGEQSAPFKEEDTTLVKESPIAFEPAPPVVQISPFLNDDDNDDWLACVGRRIRHLSMLTRWMLCLAMILSVVGMIWICMTILRTKPRRHLMYITKPSSKGGVDNVYYTIPPYSSVTDVKSPLELPPSYETVTGDEKKNHATA